MKQCPHLNNLINTFSATLKNKEVGKHLLGDGNVGRYIQSILTGISGDNSKVADYNGIEIKTKFSKSSALTLPTSLMLSNVSNFHNLIDKYGVSGRFYQKVYFRSFSETTKNKEGLKWTFKDDSFYLTGNNSGISDYYITKSRIIESMEKMKRMVFILCEENNGVIMCNNMVVYDDINFDNFLSMINLDFIFYEMKLRTGKNHGCGFRINPRHVDKIYDTVITI